MFRLSAFHSKDQLSENTTMSSANPANTRSHEDEKGKVARNTATVPMTPALVLEKEEKETKTEEDKKVVETEKKEHFGSTQNGLEKNKLGEKSDQGKKKLAETGKAGNREQDCEPREVDLKDFRVRKEAVNSEDIVSRKTQNGHHKLLFQHKSENFSANQKLNTEISTTG